MRKRFRRFAVSLLLLLTAPRVLSGQATDPLATLPDTIRLPRVDSLVRPLIGATTPGLALVIIDHGRVTHRAGYGVADIGQALPFTTATPAYVASIGKMFTAMAVLRLVQDGKLSLDTPLGEVLPASPRYAHPVTIAQLLTHTGGLVDHYDIGGEDRTYSMADVHAILAKQDSLLFPPGSNNHYSNSAYVLLAEVVARASGMPYEAYLEHTFFGPLGMHSAVVATDTSKRPKHREIGYHRINGEFRSYDYLSSTVGSGGIYCSVDDLARFALALRAGRVLTPPLLARARAMAIRTDGKGTPYGMGWLSETGRLGDRRDVHYVAAVDSSAGSGPCSSGTTRRTCRSSGRATRRPTRPGTPCFPWRPWRWPGERRTPPQPAHPPLATGPSAATCRRVGMGSFHAIQPQTTTPQTRTTNRSP